MAEAIFYFFSGLGILMFGTVLMSDGLKNLSGTKVRQTIGKFSKNRVQSFGFGIFSTLLFQSSVASIIMTMGLVSCGIVTLMQALSMTIGANIGTALTMVLLSLKSFDIIAILAMFTLVGVVINLACKSQKLKQIGNAIVGFGLLYAGLLLIDSSMGYFQGLDGFNTFISTLKNPFLLVILGAVLTMLSQSSFGTVAILISIAGTGTLAYSVMSLESMSFVVFGVNIGICLTTILASLSGNADSKRTALFNLFFNIFGVIIFMLLSLTHWTDLLSSLSPSFAIIIINLIFNLLTALLVLPLIKFVAQLMQKIFCKTKQKEETFVLSSNSMQIPAVAIKEINNAITLSFTNLTKISNCFKNYFDNIEQKEYNKLSKSLEIGTKYMQSLEQSTFSLSSTNLLEQKNLQAVCDVSQNYRRVLHNFGEILDSTLISKKAISISSEQHKVLSTLCENVCEISNNFEKIFKYVSCDDFNFDFMGISADILQKSSNITEIKVEQKKLLIGSSNKLEKYSCFLNITNQFDEIGNDLNDISVNISELLKKE